MKKKFFAKRLFQLIFFLTLLLLASCKSFAVVHAANPVPPQVRIGLYVDRGSSGGGVFHWANLIEFSPQAQLVTITGQDIRDGKLSSIDVLLMPGGYPTRQYGSMKPEGIEILRTWVKNGGGYVGSCAGLTCVLNHKGRLRLLPFYRKSNSGGASGNTQIEVSERGAQLLGVKPGKRVVTYASGPIPARGKNLDPTSTGEVLAVYKNSISYYGKPHGNMYDQPALIYGTLGKGKVIASSYHPEYRESTMDLSLGAIYAVSGVKLTPQFPEKIRRPIRVGVNASAMMGHEPIKAALALERQKHIDVRYFTLPHIDDGDLNHIDVLILLDGIAENNRNFFSRGARWEKLKRFMERGGMILASGNAATPLPDHRNLKKLPAGVDFTRYLPEQY